MRSFLFKISLLAMAVTMQLAAADHFLGTWKLDPAKSKYDPGPGPKSSTAVFSADGDWIAIKTESVSADGKATTTTNRYKRDGMDHPWNTDRDPKTTISTKLIDDHHSTATVKRDGKVTYTSKINISKDGKTRTLTTSGTNADGKKFSNVAVFTRQ